MHEANTLKESTRTLANDLWAERQLTLEKDNQLLVAKEKLKTIVTRSVEAFQMTDEYNTVLFSWYFKVFELLRRYLVKHPSGVDLETLDLEEVDQEMTADEAVQPPATKTGAPENTPASDAPVGDAPSGDNVAADARTWYLMKIFSLFFFWVPIMFWAFCKSNFKTISFYLENNIFSPVFMGL